MQSLRSLGDGGAGRLARQRLGAVTLTLGSLRVSGRDLRLPSRVASRTTSCCCSRNVVCLAGRPRTRPQAAQHSGTRLCRSYSQLSVLSSSSAYRAIPPTAGLERALTAVSTLPPPTQTPSSPGQHAVSRRGTGLSSVPPDRSAPSRQRPHHQQQARPVAATPIAPRAPAALATGAFATGSLSLL